MLVHANAKLGLAGRLALVSRIEEGRSLRAAARAAQRSRGREPRSQSSPKSSTACTARSQAGGTSLTTAGASTSTSRTSAPSPSSATTRSHSTSTSCHGHAPIAALSAMARISPARERAIFMSVAALPDRLATRLSSRSRASPGGQAHVSTFP
jgi:hypothetical protein